MPANHVLTQQQLENLFVAITRQITGMPADRVRLAYQGDGQPAQDISQNIAYIYIASVDNPYDKDRHYVEDTSDPDMADIAVIYTRVIEVMWTLYGPSAFDVADDIRHGILMEPIRQVLGREKVYPLPKPPAPSRIPYAFAGQWWQRSDLRVRFNLGTRRATSVPYIESADISIHDPDGLIKTVEVRKPE
jgi:hypothetical protein